MKVFTTRDYFLVKKKIKIKNPAFLHHDLIPGSVEKPLKFGSSFWEIQFKGNIIHTVHTTFNKVKINE